MSARANYAHLNRPAIEALSAVNAHVTTIDAKLRALLQLRISQINGCVYCMSLHSEEARSHGESQQRLDCLPGWAECKFFDARERAALAWAESLTLVSETHAPDEVYELLPPHFTEEQIVDLTFIAATMNAWNRIAIGHRAHPAQRKA